MGSAVRAADQSAPPWFDVDPRVAYFSGRGAWAAPLSKEVFFPKAPPPWSTLQYLHFCGLRQPGKP
jgi:hypothetical protein